MPRPQWPNSTNSVSEKPGTVQSAPCQCLRHRARTRWRWRRTPVRCPGAEHTRQPALKGQTVQHARDREPAQRAGRNDGNSLRGRVVDNRQALQRQSINRITTDSFEGHAHVVNPRRLARQPRAHRRCSKRGTWTSARRSGEDLAHPHQDMWCRHPAGQRRSGGPVRVQLRKPRCEPDAPATTPFRVERARVRWP